jgi:putative acetyltransferase
MNAYSLRLATPDDFLPILSVWEASVRATHHFVTEEDIERYKPLILENILPSMPVWVAIVNHQVVGFMGNKEDSLEMLFLHPGYFGKGLGREMMQMALHQLGVRKVEVNEDNPQAVAFYEKAGFKTVHRSPLDGHGDPYPILKMEWQEPSTL